ncbi:hypothetical protein [Leptospira noguchii]|uniref:Uncharacterized protein n=1 Tax=Leptospira noguchii TaxID=28182 RepID=M6VIQ3_9LEPT|nr:hypothetical protein [Leptospira noguchii]EMO54921.1 hypothetical protein LEP1GSC172_3495 [Leptospira noguchii]
MNLFTKTMSEHLEKAKENPLSRSYTERLERIDWNEVSNTVTKSLREAYEHAIESDEKVSGCLLYMSGETENGFRVSEISFAEEEDDPSYNSGPVHDDAHFNIEILGGILSEARTALSDSNREAYSLVWDATMSSFACLVGNAAEKAKEFEEFKTLNKTNEFKIAVVFHDSWGCDVETDEGLVWKSS